MHLVKSVHLVKGFVAGSSFKSVGRRGTFEEDLQRCIFHSMAGAVQETSSSELLGGEGADFLREVAFWEHQICRVDEMILLDRCSTSYDLASISWQASFLMLSTSENEVVSQKSFVFKLADKQIDRQTEIDR